MSDQDTPGRSDAAHRFFVTPFFESNAPTLSTTVGECMTTRVLSCHPDDTVYSAALTMLDGKVSALPVLAGEQVAGVLSLSDLLYRLKTPHGTIADALIEWLGGRSPDLRKHAAFRVRDAMTKPALTIAASDTVETAARCLLDHHIHQLPVVDGDRMVGIITRRDIISLLTAWAEQAAGGEKGV